jgi:transaldolase/glucose-6-phosphate isomerase
LTVLERIPALLKEDEGYTARSLKGANAVTKNSLQQLHEAGQGIWLDSIRRSLLTSGGLDRLIQGDAVTGVTSTPSIFEKAIGESSDYAEKLTSLMKSGKHSAGELFEALAVEAIQMACDTLRPIYDQSLGRDGYVSLEVSPHLLQGTAGTMAEVKRL